MPFAACQTLKLLPRAQIVPQILVAEAANGLAASGHDFDDVDELASAKGALEASIDLGRAV